MLSPFWSRKNRLFLLAVEIDSRKKHSNQEVLEKNFDGENRSNWKLYNQPKLFDNVTLIMLPHE